MGFGSDIEKMGVSNIANELKHFFIIFWNIWRFFNDTKYLCNYSNNPISGTYTVLLNLSLYYKCEESKTSMYFHHSDEFSIKIESNTQVTTRFNNKTSSDKMLPDPVGCSTPSYLHRCLFWKKFRTNMQELKSRNFWSSVLVIGQRCSRQSCSRWLKYFVIFS